MKRVTWILGQAFGSSSKVLLRRNRRVCAKSVVAPFDRVKIIFQVIPGKTLPFVCLSTRLARAEGWRHCGGGIRRRFSEFFHTLVFSSRPFHNVRGLDNRRGNEVIECGWRWQQIPEYADRFCRWRSRNDICHFDLSFRPDEGGSECFRWTQQQYARAVHTGRRSCVLLP